MDDDRIIDLERHVRALEQHLADIVEQVAVHTARVRHAAALIQAARISAALAPATIARGPGRPPQRGR
jgi:hypothetical protein